MRADSDFSESSSELCPRDSVAALGGVDRYVETARHGHSGVVRAAGLEENPQTGLALMMELAEGEMLRDFLQHATRA